MGDFAPKILFIGVIVRVEVHHCQRLFVVLTQTRQYRLRNGVVAPHHKQFVSFLQNKSDVWFAECDGVRDADRRHRDVAHVHDIEATHIEVLLGVLVLLAQVADGSHCCGPFPLPCALGHAVVEWHPYYDCIEVIFTHCIRVRCLRNVVASEECFYASKTGDCFNHKWVLHWCSIYFLDQ